MNVEVSPKALREALPGHSRAARRNRSFLACVVVPTLLVFLYLMTLASPQYATEFRFSVLDASNNIGSAFDANQSSLAFGQQISNSNASDYVVVDYLQSRQVVEDLRKRFNLAAMFKGNGFDPVFHFWWDNGSIERLYRYWRNFVIETSFDPTTGIAVVSVRAFSPQESLKLATAIAELGEKTVNELTLRPREDALHFAEAAYARAEKRLQESLKQIADFRDRNQVTDPTMDASAVTTLVSSLQTNLTTMEAQLASLGRSLSPSAPAMVMLRAEIDATKREIDRLNGLRGSGQGNGGAGEPAVLSTYNFLSQFVQFAAAFRDAMDRHLEQARYDLEVQHQYMEMHVKPAQPQAASYPKVFLWSAFTFVLMLILWAIGSLLYLSMKDHTI